MCLKLAVSLCYILPSRMGSGLQNVKAETFFTYFLLQKYYFVELYFRAHLKRRVFYVRERSLIFLGVFITCQRSACKMIS